MNQIIPELPEQAKRILVTGCPIGGVLKKTVKLLEDSGGVVVCLENCSGIKAAWQLVDEDADDIVEAIAARYLEIGCSVMTPNDRRFQHLEKLIREYRVDGVVEVDLQFCTPYLVGKIAGEHGLMLIVDASQTAGVLPIDMERMQIDILCFTGHKGLMGPQGTGGLCIREGVEIRPWKVGGSGVQSYSRTQPKEYPTRLEAGTLNSHGIAGLSAALDFIKETGVEEIARKEDALMRRFYEGVIQVPGVRVYGDFSGAEKSAIVALNIRDYDSAAVADELSVTYDIAVRPGAHCAPLMHQELGTADQGAVRFSFSWFNTEAEIDEAVRAIRELAAED